MKNLIYKEIKLVVMPVAYLMLFLSALVAIPNYPYIVGFGYSLLTLFICLSTAKANKDDEFTSSLPIPRNHIVLARHFTFVYVELLQIIVAIPFAVVSAFVINKNGNLVGLDANFTLFGVAFLCYGVMNIVFLPWFYKTSYKMGVPFFVATIAFLLCYGVIEIIIQTVPALRAALDGTAIEYMGYRLIVLFVGIIMYVVLTFASYKLSVKNFEKVSL